MSSPEPHSPDAPIFHLNSAKPGIVSSVVERVVKGTRDPLAALRDAAYLEMRRLEHTDGSELAEWRGLARSLSRLESEDVTRLFDEYARRYAWDVAGNFDPKVYKFASRAMPPLLGALLSPRATFKNLHHAFDLTALDEHVQVQGPREHIRKLTEVGTVVYVPTHLSNMDSVVFGFALERAGIPPATYGAGKNLFTNPVLSYFMHNLGAYRVDRRIKHTLYKDVLKSYSCILIERGFHSLFFPGGTRSRSGGVERKLKLGLAGTGLEAFVRRATEGTYHPVFFVPATINYLLTLEAETLIDEFLKEEGKGRYMIDDDESSRLGRVTAFVQKLMGLDAACIVRLSRPMDCFGNFVDDEGQSYDARGRVVDPTTYILGPDKRPTRDAARDAQYTRELGDAVVEAYARDTVIMSTHVAAAAAFRVFAVHSGKADLFALLRHEDDAFVPREEVLRETDAILTKLRELDDKGKVVLAPPLKRASADDVIVHALRAFATGYHSSPVMRPRGPDLMLEDTRLLLYYQNRLAAPAHGLGIDTSSGRLPARAICAAAKG